MEENDNYYLSEEGLYIRMFGGSKAPSLFPKYATDYVVHKEVVRQLYIDEIKNLLFDQKKVVYPPLPFYIGSYKFAKVKSASKFVNEVEYFYFGEKKFHRNDSANKIVDYYVSIGVHFEYTNYWDKDEDIFRNTCNMKTLNQRFKKKIKTMGGKGGSSSAIEQKKQEEEASKKRDEESCKLSQEEEQRLAKEAQKKRREEEDQKRKE